MRCPNCGSGNRPNLRFCEQCGATLVMGAAAPSQLCPHCGAANPRGLRFCEQCAAPLVAPVPAAARRERRRVGLGLLALAIILPVLFLAWRFLLPRPYGLPEPAIQLPPMSQSEALSRVAEIVTEEYPQFATTSPNIQDIELGPDKGYRLVYRSSEVAETSGGSVEFQRTLVVGVNAATGEISAAVSQ